MPSFPRIISLFVSVLFAIGLVLVAVGATTESMDSYDVTDAVALSPGSDGVESAPGSSEAAPMGSAYRLYPSFLSAPLPSSSLRVPMYSPLSPKAAGSAAPDGSEAARSPLDRQALLESNQVLAFYGKPGAPSMGILGEYSKENLAPLLEGYAKLYDEANGELGVVPAFYIIYGTCWPEGNIGILNRGVVEEYIRFAAERGWIVYLDHQLGKYAVEDSVRSMLPFLRYPNVHLAIDPEWRTTKPMEEIGYITGAELNAAQKMVDDFLRDNEIPGVRMFVVHQFRTTMIRGSETVKADFEKVILVHTADGFGPPALKKNTYAWNARSINMPVKGFKLFFQSKVPGAGSDVPLMKPDEVLALEPMPFVIMYQ